MYNRASKIYENACRREIVFNSPVIENFLHYDEYVLILTAVNIIDRR